MLKIDSSRLAPVIVLCAALALGGCVEPSDAATTSRKTVSTKSKRTTKRTTPSRTTTTKKPGPIATKVTSTTISPIALVRAGYENYLTAFVAAAREPEKASTLLPPGMTGDALTRTLELRRLDAADGVFWDGTRQDIVSGPVIERVGETTATLRDCRSVAGVLRQRSSGAVVAGTTEPDVDDLRVSLVRSQGRWLVTAVDAFNDIEGRSRCRPGLPPLS